MSQEPFKSWAVVEVMGHNEYAGYVTAETIAGAAMLRIDVPKNSRIDGFTKYLSMQSIYGISPCTEQTARARGEANKKAPFESWSVEQQMMAALKAAGRLVEPKGLPGPDHDDDEDDEPCGGDDERDIADCGTLPWDE